MTEGRVEAGSRIKVEPCSSAVEQPGEDARVSSVMEWTRLARANMRHPPAWRRTSACSIPPGVWCGALSFCRGRLKDGRGNSRACIRDGRGERWRGRKGRPSSLYRPHTFPFLSQINHPASHRHPGLPPGAPARVAPRMEKQPKKPPFSFVGERSENSPPLAQGACAGRVGGGAGAGSQGRRDGRWRTGTGAHMAHAHA